MAHYVNTLFNFDVLSFSTTYICIIFFVEPLNQFYVFGFELFISFRLTVKG
jgi:hypothetical protein